MNRPMMSRGQRAFGLVLGAGMFLLAGVTSSPRWMAVVWAVSGVVYAGFAMIARTESRPRGFVVRDGAGLTLRVADDRLVPDPRGLPGFWMLQVPQEYVLTPPVSAEISWMPPHQAVGLSFCVRPPVGEDGPVGGVGGE